MKLSNYESFIGSKAKVVLNIGFNIRGKDKKIVKGEENG